MDRARGCVIKQLEDIRLKLLDLTNRNRLLNFKYRGGCIRIVDERPEQVFDYLVKQGKQMTFLPLPEEPETSGEDDREMQLFAEADDVSFSGENLPQPAPADGEVRLKHENGTLQTKLEAELLETRLRRIRSDARSFVQETGNNHLFLAVGFLHWRERADNAQDHEAPLILVPIEIEQDRLNRKAQQCTYKMRHTGEDVVANLSLREKLRRDYGLDLPMFNEEGATGATADEEFDPEAYFDTITNAVTEMPGWEVRREIVVAFFTFSKLQMYLDLDPDAWPGSCIADHDVIQRLLGCAEHLPDGSTEAQAAETFDADSLPIVLDADSSQMKAIREGIGKGSMVIQGPPGTGKSQTITNLIACLLAEGKSVLFVAEKMAALEVVYRNLERVGLSGLCLELHSHKTDKKEVINSLKARYEERGRLRKTGPVDSSRDLDRLRKTRNALAEYIELLKKPIGPADETVFDIFGKAELSRQKLSEIIPLRMENIDALTHDQIENAQDLIQQLSRLLCETGRPAESPWYGYEPVNLIGGDQDSVARDIQTVLTATSQVAHQARTLFEQTHVSICAAELAYPWH
jgi:hypothetical protein